MTLLKNRVRWLGHYAPADKEVGLVRTATTPHAHQHWTPELQHKRQYCAEAECAVCC